MQLHAIVDVARLDASCRMAMTRDGHVHIEQCICGRWIPGRFTCLGGVRFLIETGAGFTEPEKIRVRSDNEGRRSLLLEILPDGAVSAQLTRRLRMGLDMRKPLGTVRQDVAPQWIEPTDQRSVRMDRATAFSKKHAGPSVGLLEHRAGRTLRASDTKFGRRLAELARKPRHLIGVDLDVFVMATAQATMAFVAERFEPQNRCRL